MDENLIKERGMKRTMEAVKKFIKGEIKWCKNNMGSSFKSVEYEKGFIEGLKQSLRLIKEAEKEF